MSQALEELLALLRVEQITPDHFRGIGSSNDGAEATYGGHFLGQACMAALETVENDRLIHSLHGYFLRGGQPGQAIDYHVENIREGRSFCSRRVYAKQDEKTLFEMAASFATAESGSKFAAVTPHDFNTLPQPESLPRYEDLMASLDPLPLPEDWALREHGIDVRVINAPWTERGPSAEQGIRMWIRTNGSAPADPKLHAAMLAYQSDESLADNILVPFDRTWGSPGTFCVSLDHSLWFHQPINLNAWHFVEQRPVVVDNGRGLGQGYVWSEGGSLVASFTQEVLIRL